MSNERDELFQLMLGRTTTKAVERILAAGYRKPRTITTAEELDALPVDTAIIGTSHEPKRWPGSPYAKTPNGEWFDYGNGYTVGSDDIMLPATIIFEPEVAP